VQSLEFVALLWLIKPSNLSHQRLSFFKLTCFFSFFLSEMWNWCSSALIFFWVKLWISFLVAQRLFETVREKCKILLEVFALLFSTSSQVYFQLSNSKPD
jgi:hypothetical protein